MKKTQKTGEDYSKLSSIIKNHWFILKIAMKEAPFYTIHVLTGRMLHEIVVFIEHIYMIGYIIDCIQYQRPFMEAALFIIIVFVSVRGIQIIGNIFCATIEPKGKEKIYKRLRLELYDKASKIDLECYDNPEFYNDFVWAMNDMPDRFSKVMDTVSKLLGGITGIAVAGGYMLSTDWAGLILVVISFAISFLVYGKYNKLQVKLDLASKPLIRKRDYINRVFYLNDFAKELRTGNIKKKLYRDFEDANEELEDVIDKGTKKLPLLGFIGQFVCEWLLFNTIYVIYLLYKAIIQGSIGFGSMYTLFSAAGSVSDCMRALSQTLPQTIQNSMYIDKVRKFLSYDVKISDKQNALDIPTEFSELKLENVSFSYQKNSEPILKNISLTIKRGEKIALVGYNGAGKTTLVKLLMRLYDSSGGTISLNGKPISEYKVEQYRFQFATVFQDYQLFAASVRENVTMEPPDGENIKSVDQRVTSALTDSGFADKLKALTGGLDTTLTREFSDDGTNLSGGEAQKVAIGRVLYKECPIIILDEPSSALDPLSEYALNNTMLNMSSEKTVVFISHRLSTTMMADKIYMLENGEIVEQGKHDELIAQNGKYAEMFNLQAEKYR